MTESQKKSLALSEARSKLNGLIEERNKMPSDKEPSKEQVEAMDAATRKVGALEIEYRAAVTAEEQAGSKKEPETTEESQSPEEREMAELYGKASLRDYFVEVLDKGRADGASKEYREAFLGSDMVGYAPISMLMDPEEIAIEERRAIDRGVEHRAVTPVAASALGLGTQAPVLGRVFTRSVASRLGVSMPSVPAGTRNYPYMTGGTTISNQSDGGSQAAVAGSFEGKELAPIRMTGSYEWNIRETLLMPQLESALRADLRMAFTDQMDNQAINGSGSSPNPTGFIAELPAPDHDGAVTTWDGAIGKFAEMVDGLNSYDVSDLAAVMHPELFDYLFELYAPNNVNRPRENAWEYLRMKLSGLSVTSRISGNAGSGSDAALSRLGIVAKRAYPGTNAVMPIWRAMQLIADPYTLAQAGQMRVTAVGFYNFKVIRETGWALVSIRDRAS